MEYFSDLGIRKGATLSEIKNAFKKLALKFHPDKVKSSLNLNVIVIEVILLTE